MNKYDYLHKKTSVLKRLYGSKEKKTQSQFSFFSLFSQKSKVRGYRAQSFPILLIQISVQTIFLFTYSSFGLVHLSNEFVETSADLGSAVQGGHFNILNQKSYEGPKKSFYLAVICFEVIYQGSAEQLGCREGVDSFRICRNATSARYICPTLKKINLPDFQLTL